MEAITTKLKRCKLTVILINLIFLPITIPLFILMKLGGCAEYVLGVLNNLVWILLDKIATTFKFDEVAKSQYENNKSKFI